MDVQSQFCVNNPLDCYFSHRSLSNAMLARVSIQFTYFAWTRWVTGLKGYTCAHDCCIHTQAVNSADSWWMVKGDEHSVPQCLWLFV